jgi:hypothetical protein
MADSERSTLVDALRGQGAWVEETLRGLTEERLAQGRYENGWSARQILAHVAAIEWTYPRLLELAKSTGAAADDGEARAATSARGGIDEYNRRQVEKREGDPVNDLVDEFVRNRAALVAAVEAADEALFAVRVRSAGGREGSLGNVLREVAIEHVEGHLRDIVGN